MVYIYADESGCQYTIDYMGALKEEARELTGPQANRNDLYFEWK